MLNPISLRPALCDEHCMAVTPEIEQRERRVLLLAPTAKDGAITSALLTEAGLDCMICKTIGQVSQELSAGAGVILLTEETLTAEGIEDLLTALNFQPSWSDLPA